MTLFSKLTFDHSRWQVSRVKQGTLTPPEHLVPHPLEGALNRLGVHWHDIYILLMLSVMRNLYIYNACIYIYSIYGIKYRYWICLLVLLIINRCVCAYMHVYMYIYVYLYVHGCMCVNVCLYTCIIIYFIY